MGARRKDARLRVAGERAMGSGAEQVKRGKFIREETRIDAKEETLLLESRRNVENGQRHTMDRGSVRILLRRIAARPEAAMALRCCFALSRRGGLSIQAGVRGHFDQLFESFRDDGGKPGAGGLQ